jgi:small GTP-binding protein
MKLNTIDKNSNNASPYPEILTKLISSEEKFEQIEDDDHSFWHARRIEEKKFIFSLNKKNELTRIALVGALDINFEILSQCSSLIALYISNYQFNPIPKEIFKLSNLNTLELSNCNISIIPTTISQLKSLTRLDLSNNNITQLPEIIFELSKLKRLIVNNNLIKNLPSDIQKLKEIEILSIAENELSEIPEFISKLNKLKYLLANNNKLTKLPIVIGQMNGIKILLLQSNKLKSLPKSIINLTKLEHLQLDNNLFSKFPKEICSLSSLDGVGLSNNKIKSIPLEISKLTKLMSLDLSENPINFPDPSFHSLTPQEKIHTLLAMQNSPLKPLKQAKILVVGDERVGKTSIINRLLGNPHNENQTSTQGIDISELEFDEYKTNIWDFAGQELTHQTHQFFLTERSLYIYVLDAQKEDNQARDLHWLNTIKSYSNNSPIIVVVNHSDQNLNYRFDKLRYQDNFQIADVIYTSACNLNKLNEQAKNHLRDSIAILTKAISLQLPKLPGIGRELPESWHHVKGAMESFKENLNVIEKDAYDIECEKAGVVGKSLQTALLKILNSIGTIVAFPNDFRLQLTQILKPEWVTNAVYKIIRSQSDTPGIYSEKLISSILDGDYTHTHQQWLIDLLIKFELGFRLPENSELLIPMRLPSVMPDYTKSKYQKGLNIRFNYHNNGLLKLNVLPQLIVRLHHYVDDDTSKYWRHGIFIQLKSCRGVIVADESKQIIEVFLSEKNEDARTLLQWIRSNIEKIEDSQTKANKGVLPYSEEIALFDDNCKA